MIPRLISRRVIPGLASIAACAGLLAAPGPAGAHDELTVVSWGGAYTRSQVLAYFRPYRARTGNRLNIVEYNGGLEEIRDQVASLVVKWDVVDLTLSDAIRGCEEGLLAKIDHSMLPPAPDGTPATADFIDGTLTECGVGEILWSTTIVYDRSRFGGKAPAGVADFWDRKAFPGGRGMRRVPQKNLEWALMADGVPRRQVYQVLDTPKGVDRAFRSLDRIKPAIVWWTSGDEPARMLAEGAVSMTTAWNGRIFDAVRNRALPAEIVWTDSIWDIDLWGIVKESPNLEMALDFVRFATGTQPLAAQAEHIAYGPARLSSLAQVSDSIKPHLPTTPDNLRGAIQFDSQWWAQNQARMNERFEAWLAEPSAKPEQLPR